MRPFQIMTGTALFLVSVFVQALEIQPYTAAALGRMQKAGEPVALHFHASWCPTCRAQEKGFQSLRSDKSLNITLLVADYDKERELRRQLGVRTQSVIIVYRGSKEIVRSGGETRPEKLRVLLRQAL